MWVLVLIACHAPQTTPSPDPASPDLVTEAPAAEWSVEDALAQVESLLEAGFPEPHTARDTYFDLMSHGDDICPGDPSQITDTWLEGCTAESGYWYAGVSVYEHEDSGEAGERWELGGDFEIITAEGVIMSVGGHALYGWEQDDDGLTWSAQLTGVWDYPDGAPWMAGGASMWLGLYGGEDAVGAWTVIDGGLGLATANVRFDQMLFDAATCGGAPTGALEIRDPTGYWYTLTLDCGTCGPMTFQGEEAGEQCLDLIALGESLIGSLGAP